MAVGIVDIAKHVQVSHTTVSRVLNNRKGAFVSDKTRRLIEETAQQMGYRPNALARGLRGAKTETIGIAVPGFFKQIDPVERMAADAGYRVHMAAHHRREADFRQVLGDFMQHNVDGVLVHSSVPHMETILRQDLPGKPVVLCCEEPVAGYDCFIDARYEAARTAVDFLVDLGHWRIGLLVNHTRPEMRWRVAGYRDRMRDLGLAVDENWLWDMPTDVPSAERGHRGATAALSRLSAAQRPTAILCTNDDVAVGALAAAAEFGLDVPGDLSVMGMMNLDHAPFARVPLTTVDWDVMNLIAQGMKRLLERIKSPESATSVIEKPPTVVVRASVGPPNEFAIDRTTRRSAPTPNGHSTQVMKP